MEGAAEEAPTPCRLPFSRPLSARPRPAGCRRRRRRCSPAPQEPHRPKMAAPRLPPRPPAAGSDAAAAAAWSPANQRGGSECRLLLLGATRPVGSEPEVRCRARRLGPWRLQRSSSGPERPGIPDRSGWARRLQSPDPGRPHHHACRCCCLQKLSPLSPGHGCSQGWSYRISSQSQAWRRAQEPGPCSTTEVSIERPVMNPAQPSPRADDRVQRPRRRREWHANSKTHPGIHN
ncbi:hypothetical protein NN561_006844 [Cricetulus griseus]